MARQKDAALVAADYMASQDKVVGRAALVVAVGRRFSKLSLLFCDIGSIITLLDKTNQSARCLSYFATLTGAI